MAKKLKNLIGTNDSTSCMVGSAENLKMVKGEHVGSCLNITITSDSGAQIGRFMIHGEHFDRTIDPLIEGIRQSLVLRLSLLQHEIAEIETLVK